MVVQLLLRIRILDILKSVQPSNKWKILLVDETSLKIINSALSMSDLTDQFVLRVENMFSPTRVRCLDNEAIYFAVPTLASVHKIIEDLIPENSKYSLGHVFFTERLPTNLSRKLKESRSMVKIGTLKELYVNFTAIEKRVFTLNMPQCLKIAFNPSNISLQKYGLQKMAKSLASILFLMGEKPEVRYYGPPKIGSSGNKDSPAKLLAECLRQELDTYVDQQFLAGSESKSFPHTNMLILDRSIDILCPVLHNSTYMGLLIDLLDFDNMGVTLNNSEHTRVELSDLDNVWQKVKYMHIADAISSIVSSLQKFSSENKAAKWSKMSKGVDGVRNSSTLKQIEEMKDALSSLPKYHELTAKYNLHTDLCKNIMDIYNSSSMDDIISFEQNIAVGHSSSKNSPPNFKDIMALFESGKLTKQEIARILIMYFAVRDGVPDSERLQLESTFSKCPDIIQVMHNITYLGVRLSSNFLQMIQENKEPVYYRSTPKEKKSVFENDRYVPILKDILHNFIKTPSIDSIFHLIPESDTNFVNLPNQRGLISKSNPGVASNLSSAHSGSSIAMAKNKASWATRRGRGTEKNDDGSDSLRDSDEGDIKTYGSRVIVFVIGGISCAELRAANEVMQNTGREVIVGSSNLIVPSLFINEVENLNSPLDSSDLFGVKSESVFIEKKNNDVSYKSKYSLKEVLAPTTAIPKRTNISSKPVTSTTASPLSKSVRAPLGKMGLFEVPSRSKSREVQKGSTSEQASTEQKKKKPWKFL